ncbi:hypothetical protein Hypma_014775 [Hypsizygus marmoreus]|uniref:Uncharacterized protein n=1 Tax=Hypsizygus marmoreus TaxID=39966 RepID=A0A369JDK0_HYPMA|nr:hypothetical protein Hypma_014775 [Hypsizygus marmoreus]
MGGVYVTFNNLHRGVRFLQHNVILIMTIPGPHELSLEQLNHCLEPFVNDFITVYQGMRMCLASYSELQVVNNGLVMQVSDISASHKVNGVAAHSHKDHLYDVCKISLKNINTEKGYDTMNFKLREDFQQLWHSFDSKNTPSAAA